MNRPLLQHLENPCQPNLGLTFPCHPQLKSIPVLLILLLGVCVFSTQCMAQDGALLIDDFSNPIPEFAIQDQDGTFPVSTGTTVLGNMLGGELDALLVLNGVENPSDAAYFAVDGGRAIFHQDATAMGQALLIYDGVDGDAARVVASTGLHGGMDLTQGGTLDGLDVDIARNDLPLKIGLVLFTEATNISEQELDVPVIDTPTTLRIPFSELTANRGNGVDLTRVTTVLMSVGALDSAVGSAHIEIDRIQASSSPTPEPNEPEPNEPEPNEPPSSPVILFDQILDLAGTDIWSVNFPGDNPFDAIAADDFVVPAGETWMIQDVEWAASFIPGPPSHSTVNVTIYSDAGGLPGDPLFSETDLPVIPMDNAGQTWCALPSEPWTLDEGIYWISTQSNVPVGTEMLITESRIANGNPYVWQNPDGAFGTSCSEWTPSTSCLGHQPSLAIRLWGTVNTLGPNLFSSSNFEPPVKSMPPACGCTADCPDEDEGIGDPLYGFSGEYYTSEVDLQIPGRGLDFIWARKYRSKVGPDSALGHGWDFSYNIRIVLDGNDLILFDGNTRQDRYMPQGDGIWAADGLFRTFQQETPDDPDTDYVLTFADTSVWRFHGFTHAQAPGSISAITDRNDNAIHFDYDNQGRLTTIHDTLDTDTHNRDITIAYNGDGFIASVTDFVGRKVRYAYYQDGDVGGSSGDLKSVTSPAVTGTPHGNDFPQGKTTTYTYTKGFTDERLNHNLLTITDPKGQTYLTNVYAQTQNPDDNNFDRVIRQIWGDPCDMLDFVYTSQTPSADNGFATSKTIVNDRVGHVQEYFYDAGNRLVLERVFTGQANANQPTTETQNRPVGQLRPDDPVFFETRYQYNIDSMTTRIDYPNGNATVNVYELDLNPNAPRRSRGNLREVHHLPGVQADLSDANEIVERYEYVTDLAGCCGTNFVTREIDGRGNVTLHDYDDWGNRLRTQHRIPSIIEEWQYNEFGQVIEHRLPDNGSGHRRQDRYEYYSDPTDPRYGYLQRCILDAENLALATTFDYDAIGNITRIVDARGHDTQFVYNALNQVIRERSRPINDANGIRYEKDTFYDENNNIVRVDTINIDDQGVLQDNTHFTTLYEYDILNSLIRTSQEVGSFTGDIPGVPERPDYDGLPDSEFMTTLFDYDGNRNRTMTIYGEAAEGRQPANVVQRVYDERDLLFTEIRAPGDPNQSTTQCDYDGNGNVAKVMQGLEGNPRVTRHLFDGYDRCVATTDPMGNTVTYQYDRNDNRVTKRIEGEIQDNGPGDANNVRLWETTETYDAMDRRIRSEIAFFDTETQTPLGDGSAATDAVYSDTSQILSVTNDNNHAVHIVYDTANRRMMTQDAKGNTATYLYDDNSNIIKLTHVETSDLGEPNQTFISRYTYDGIDRLISSADSAGNIHTYGYDSRNNHTRVLDALGNEVRVDYDGLDRRIATIRDLDGDGADGNGADITTQQYWDDSSRRITRTDDNAHTTTWAYDALNRLTRTTYADGTQRTFGYDVHDNRIQQTDGNGSVITTGFDLLNRPFERAILPGQGVSQDTTIENYVYDGLSRLVTAQDDDSTVVRRYDSLSHVTQETLNGQITTTQYDAVGNWIACTYPGGRQVTYTYDALERIQTVSAEDNPLATYAYVGQRVSQRDYNNQTRLRYTYDGITGIANPANDFGVQQVIATTHIHTGDNTVIDDRRYSWDPMGNKIQHRDIRTDGPLQTQAYTYDRAYRLIQTTVANSIGTVVNNVNYQLDGAGNRNNVFNLFQLGSYTLDDTTPVPADFPMNQYTQTPFDSRQYDDNGNLVQVTHDPVGGAELTYDYRNQLARYADSATGKVTHYTYDALGRRIGKQIDDGQDAKITQYYYEGTRVIEEQDTQGTTQATYIYGRYIDEVLQMQRNGEKYYYHADDLYSVTAVTDPNGSVVERYAYDDYGRPHVFDPNGTQRTNSVIGNPYLFTGRRFDSESSLYYYRTRYLDPSTGRFITRDTIGIWADADNLGNGYTYAANNPTSRVDPTGMDPPEFTYMRDLEKWKVLAQSGNPEAVAQVLRLQRLLGIEDKPSEPTIAGEFIRELPGAIAETFASGEAYQSFAQGSLSALNLMTFGLVGDPEQRARELEREGYKRPDATTESVSRFVGRWGIGLPLTIAVGLQVGGPVGEWVAGLPLIGRIPYLGQAIVWLTIWGDDIYIWGNVLWNFVKSCMDDAPSESPGSTSTPAVNDNGFTVRGSGGRTGYHPAGAGGWIPQ